MKISIITLHRVFNYGSVLQAYATELFFKRLGCETEIIDYLPIKWQNKSLYWDVADSHGFIRDSLYRCMRAVSILMKKRTFWSFLKKYTCMTKMYKSYEQLNQSKITTDICCTGSDQVWNSNYCGIDKSKHLNIS